VSRPVTLSRVLILPLAACSDYDLKAIDEPEGGAPADTGVSVRDTAEPEPDTGAVPDDEVDLGTATAVIYLNTEDTLYAWDPETGVTEVGRFSDPAARMTDIAIDMAGTMVGIATNELYEIDARTGDLTFLCALEDWANGLTFLSDGRLVTAGADLLMVDRVTCAATPLSRGSGFQTSGDVVGIPGERLLWTVNSSGGDGLVEVDPDTGTATLIGNLGVSSLWGVGYSDGLLYGFSANEEVVVIDPHTATVSSRAPLPRAWWGAATNPVRWSSTGPTTP